MAGTEEKKLPPSAKKLRKARREGQVAISRDLSAAMASLAATGVLVAMGTFFTTRLMQHLATSLRGLGDRPARDIAPADLMPFVIGGGALLAMVAGPIALAAAGTSLATSFAQTKMNFTTHKLKFNWGALNPSNGLSRLTPSKAGLDTLKAMILATVVGILAWKVGVGLSTDAPLFAFYAPVASAKRGWSDATRLLWQVGFLLLALGGGDYALQRFRLHQGLRMSHQDVKQEQKEEGSPEVKGRIRRVQREMHRRRMLQNVKSATVIITNPTHFAVALQYDRSKGPAPIVVAKGADRMAAKIRALGREHSIPIMENPPLARALFAECEVGDTIPGPLFGAVAEVLAYLIRIKQLVI